mmetsp:Transcript_14603/g.31178  ORF Transcript_14603/g.31178 Transcript_14603/m.31178 type:complete len:89 (+) Transcript_14603:226-492(+)|eukprot:CAMPEP_0203790638 /NCGR_PEP_ID=MMETSP0100_2-20121128/4162_1 /ASSEMBLY_ACC=CAM_ASM_000210 /TAXON_ID=96639 /ORGANISM=" , Strain NY0313808BC1" /LENGTH=88 /DNA_ID=CAMNT_0050693811 /DNA_START=266 /DNA_END=532 /DNA_ORIENTATION=-
MSRYQYEESKDVKSEVSNWCAKFSSSSAWSTAESSIKNLETTTTMTSADALVYRGLDFDNGAPPFDEIFHQTVRALPREFNRDNRTFT